MLAPGVKTMEWSLMSPAAKTQTNQDMRRLLVIRTGAASQVCLRSGSRVINQGVHPFAGAIPSLRACPPSRRHMLRPLSAGASFLDAHQPTGKCLHYTLQLAVFRGSSGADAFPLNASTSRLLPASQRAYRAGVFFRAAGCPRLCDLLADLIALFLKCTLYFCGLPLLAGPCCSNGSTSHRFGNSCWRYVASSPCAVLGSELAALTDSDLPSPFGP